MKIQDKQLKRAYKVSLITTLLFEIVVGLQLNRFIGHFKFYLWWHLLDVKENLGP